MNEPSGTNRGGAYTVIPQKPLSHLTYQPPLSTVNPAKWTRERLFSYIKDFEEKLDSDHEIGAYLVSSSSGVTFHIDDIGYYGPDIISFYGVAADNSMVQLIQHITQLLISVFFSIHFLKSMLCHEA